MAEPTVATPSPPPAEAPPAPAWAWVDDDDDDDDIENEVKVADENGSSDLEILDDDLELSTRKISLENPVRWIAPATSRCRSRHCAGLG